MLCFSCESGLLEVDPSCRSQAPDGVTSVSVCHAIQRSVESDFGDTLRPSKDDDAPKHFKMAFGHQTVAQDEDADAALAVGVSKDPLEGPVNQQQACSRKVTLRKLDPKRNALEVSNQILKSSQTFAQRQLDRHHHEWKVSTQASIEFQKSITAACDASLIHDTTKPINKCWIQPGRFARLDARWNDLDIEHIAAICSALRFGCQLSSIHLKQALENADNAVESSAGGGSRS